VRSDFLEGLGRARTRPAFRWKPTSGSVEVVERAVGVAATPSSATTIRWARCSGMDSPTLLDSAMGGPCDSV